MPQLKYNSPTGVSCLLATWGLVCAGLLSLGNPAAWAQTPEKPDAKPAVDSPRDETADQPEAKPADVLAVGQGEVADRFKQLKRMMLHLSEFSANSDPHRASVLKQAISETEQKELALRFEAVVKLLEKGQFALAEKNQTELRADLEKLLQLLLKEDRANRVDQEKKRIEGLIKEVGRIIKDQRGVKARTEGGDNLKRLTEDQEKIDAKAKNLAEQIAKDEAENKASAGESPDQNNPSDSKAADPNKADPNKADPKQGGEDASGGEKKPDPSSPKKEEAGKSGSKPDSEKKEKPKQPAAGTPPEPEENSSPMQGGSEPMPGSEQSGEPKQGEPKQGKPMSGEPQSGDPQSGENGEPMDQSPPKEESDNERVRKRIEAARERMEDAQKKLEEAERKGAAEKQQEALDELEQAKAELERILKQLREEEVERVLVQLEDRFRRMLKQQIAVYEGTKRLDSIAAAERGRDDEIEVGRLSRLEAELVIETDKALNLLKAEGSAVAFPEAVTQMRDDMELIAGRLSQFKTAKITQGLEEDVISALEEMIEALKRAQKELEEQKNQAQQPQSGGQQGDQALIDALAELRMIRALQMRVNSRTKLYSGMIAGEQADSPELIKALDDLSVRQERIHQVTRDLHLGKNK